MPRVWVSLGSNMQREHSVRGAVDALQSEYGVLTLSRVYESAAEGFEGEPFYNLVAGFDTEETPEALNLEFKRIEAAFGRESGGEKFAPRPLDIDLLTYGERVQEGDGVELPRGEILRYAFVLGPLAEVAGAELHPQEGLSYGELWQRFDQAAQPLIPVELDLLSP